MTSESKPDFKELVNKVIGEESKVDGKLGDDFGQSEAQAFLNSVFESMGLTAVEEMMDEMIADEDSGKIEAVRCTTTISGTFEISADVDDVDDVHQILNDLISNEVIKFRIKEVKSTSYFE